MKNSNTYKFTKYIVYILLVGQLWYNVFSYAIFYNQDTDDLIELTSTENENELENKKNFENKIILPLFVTSTYNNKLSTNFIHKENLLRSNFPEINTPPPKYIFSI